MKLVWSESSWMEYQEWQKDDKKILKKINELIKEILRDPKSGLGKSEKLKYELSGCYSRRINKEHRLVYFIENESLNIVSCKYHYTK